MLQQISSVVLCFVHNSLYLFCNLYNCILLLFSGRWVRLFIVLSKFMRCLFPFCCYYSKQMWSKR